MKNTFLAIALCLSPALVMAAQIPVTQIDKFNSTATKIDDVRVATNVRLAAAQSNFTELYTLLGGNPWLAQTTAPNIYNVFWIDTSGTGPVLKYWDGNSWEALTFDSTGEYALPVATTSTLGGVKDGAGVTIAADGTISADDQLVGDCTAGPCLDGTSDGGSYIKLWAGTGSYWTALQGGSPAANRSWRLPTAAPPAAGTTYLMNMDEYGQMGFVPAVSDTAYGVGWNGDTGAASKNAIYDKIETIAGGTDDQTAAEVSVADIAGHYTATNVETVLAEIGAAPFISWDAATITEVENSPAVGTNTISVKSGVFQAYDSDWLGVTANGAALISADNNAAMKTLLDLEPGVDYDAATPLTLNLASDTDITASQLLSNKFISNQGASGEVDITLPAVSYSITRTVLVEETQIVEINPPSGEAFDLAGTMLDANDCIDSPPTVGAKAVFTRMQDASGVWHWSVDQVRGTWVDTGASD